MLVRDQLAKKIIEVSPDNFNELALKVFNFQYNHNILYKQYVDLLRIVPSSVNSIEAIPFLPIQFFKNNIIKSDSWHEEIVFSSSGTTGKTTSKHFVRSLEFYQQIAANTFEKFYGPLEKYTILGLLPSYLERSDSSLVYMVDHFIKLSTSPLSGFYLDDFEKLLDTIVAARKAQSPVIVIGVTFALLDMADRFTVDLSDCILMETGGMKGKRKELIRSEVHQQLHQAFNVETVHSEYGMTELLSQGYSKGNGLFEPGYTMRILTREVTDPLTLQKTKRNGVLNIIDLANLDTCSFLATDDLGKVYADGSFEVAGRLDTSDIRGCNLLFV